MATIRPAKESTKFRHRLMKKLGKAPNLPIHIGLDVHKNSIHAAIYRDGAILADWRTSANSDALAEQLSPMLPFTKGIAYEAGPTGFSLARILQQRGFNVIVCAPAHTPRAGARQNKSDRIDAAKLAQFSAYGLLKAVTIPTEQEEQERLVLRHRNALADKLRRVKQQIKAEFLFTGAGEVASWNRKEVERLASAPCSEGQRFALDSLLREMALLEDEVKKTNGHIERIMSGRHAEAKAILESHPGIGPITAAIFALELFRPKRFRNGRAVARFLGLAPGLNQTGETDRPQPLLKTGQARLRAQLIEAAWRWIRLDPAARSVHGRLLHNTGNTKKAIAGMARRLAVRLWTMWTRAEMYDPAKAKFGETQDKDRRRVAERKARRELKEVAEKALSTAKAVGKAGTAGTAHATRNAKAAGA